MPGSPWGQVVGSLPSPHYPHSSPQSPASQVLGASPPALPAPGDPALGSGEHPQMVRSACPLCRTPRQGTDGEQAAGGGGGQPPPPQLQALSRGPRAGQVPRLGRSAVHITGRLCDRDGEAFRSSRGGTGLGAPRLATWKSNGVSSRGSRHRRGLGGSPHLGFSGYHGVGGDSQGATRGYRGGRGSSACSALMPQGRVSGSLVQSQLSLSHRAVVRNGGCWCRQHDLT